MSPFVIKNFFLNELSFRGAGDANPSGFSA
jgi:hypothetical protein